MIFFPQEFEVSEDYNRLNHRRNYLGNDMYKFISLDWSLLAKQTAVYPPAFSESEASFFLSLNVWIFFFKKLRNLENGYMYEWLAGQMLFLVVQSSTPWPHLSTANWSASCQFGFLTKFCSFTWFVSLFVLIGPEKPIRGINFIDIYEISSNNSNSFKEIFINFTK